MPQTVPCTICTHPRRAEIERALREGRSLRRVATLFGVGRMSLHRHKVNHMTVTDVTEGRRGFCYNCEGFSLFYSAQGFWVCSRCGFRVDSLT